MIEMGLIVAAGMVFMFSRLSWKRRVWMLSRPLLLDVSVFVLLSLLHWGTFSGMMVAAIGALVCSMCISLGRKMFGYTAGKRYVPGWINVESKL